MKGIDLEKADDEFFKKWNESTIFKIFSFNDYEFKKELINLVDDMKHFGKLFKLLKLHDNKGKKNIDVTISNLLCDKFKELIKTYKVETCPNFFKDVSFFIYINDSKNQNIKDFLKNIIVSNIKSEQTLNDIYLDLFSNYKDISNNLMEFVANYYTDNKDLLDIEKILFLFQKFDIKYFKKLILNRINSLIIKEEEFFSQEKDIKSFKLLNEILKLELFKDPELSETDYIKNTRQLCDKILNDIEAGNIKYDLFSSMWNSKDNKNILKDRINTINIKQLKNENEYMAKLEERYKNIITNKKYLKKLSGVLNEFYKIMYKDNIEEISKLENQINAGMLNVIEEKEIKSKIDEINNSFKDFDLDKKSQLKQSKFFTNFFNIKKENLIKTEDEIFNETKEDFQKLKSFFEEDWMNKIDESIIKECYKEIKYMDDKKILSELKFLRDYFEIKDKDDLYLAKLLDEIKILSQKEEIFQIVNSIIDFILEFKLKKNDNNDVEIKKTEFYESLNKLRDELPKNISIDKIRDYGNVLEKYGITILNQKQEDKDFLNIIRLLYSKKGSLNFILKLTDDDCRRLQELVSEAENTFLTGTEIQALTECSDFINNLGDIRETTTDKELIEILKQKVNE